MTDRALKEMEDLVTERIKVWPGAAQLLADIVEIVRVSYEAGKEAAAPAEQATPSVYIMPMALADGRTDYFVAIKVGDKVVTPHVFREEYKAAYHVALYDWLLNGTGGQPDCVEFGPTDWPAQRHSPAERASDDYNQGYNAGVEWATKQYSQPATSPAVSEPRFITDGDRAYADGLLEDLREEGLTRDDAAQWFCKARVENARRRSQPDTSNEEPRG